MKRAGDFLAKFNKLTPPQGSVRRAVVESVARVAGVSLKESDVSLSRGVVFLQCSSVAKSAIRLVRGVIFEDLYQHLPKARDQVRDIR